MSRNMPQWMAAAKPRSQSEEKFGGNPTPPLPVRRLRSNYSFEDVSQKNENKVELNDYPFIDYRGEIVYCMTAPDIASACDKLLQMVDNVSSIVPIAFDMEWPFSFKTGPGKSALIQLCADTKLCYLFQISELCKLPSALMILLKHPRICLHGVNIKNDFRKLERDFSVDVTTAIAQCVDLGVWANTVLNTSGRWSLERLVLKVCKLKINKDKTVRMSKWNIAPLSDNQKLYAAIDVYIGQVIYLELKALEKQCLEACAAMQDSEVF